MHVASITMNNSKLCNFCEPQGGVEKCRWKLWNHTVPRSIAACLPACLQIVVKCNNDNKIATSKKKEPEAHSRRLNTNVIKMVTNNMQCPVPFRPKLTTNYKWNENELALSHKLHELCSAVLHAFILPYNQFTIQSNDNVSSLLPFFLIEKQRQKFKCI